MDYSKVVADQVWGEEIGRLFVEASPFITTMARVAYRQFADQVDIQFAALSETITVVFQDEEPYEVANELFEDVSKGLLRVHRTTRDQEHPLLTQDENNRFRAVHDFYGHFATGRDFSRHGEEAAWMKHSRMFNGLGRAAMTTETRGQSSAFIWINGGKFFPPQKAVLLPSWVSEIPSQYV